MEHIIDQIDAWQHLPNFQLERRVSLLFTRYLPEVLEIKLGYAIHPILIPEFPARIGTVMPNNPTNRSFKIDFVALSEARDKAVFMEIKTTSMPRRSEQDRYLQAAGQVGLPALLEGLLIIYRMTSETASYLRLLDFLVRLDLLEIPDEMYTIVNSSDHHGLKKLSRSARVTCTTDEHRLIYIQPTGDADNVISYADICNVVKRYDDPFSQRLADSLPRWADARSGGAGSLSNPNG